MGALNWTAESERWLKDIYDYIARDNPNAAAQVVEGIFERAQVLLDFPEIGYRYQPSSDSVRILLLDEYRIAYLINSDSNIDVLGVFHGALDIDRYLL